jgi:hypothetical protein
MLDERRRADLAAQPPTKPDEVDRQDAPKS